MSDEAQTLGPYHLVRQLGKGANGVVWLAERRGLITTQIAIKVPIVNEDDIEELAKEARAWMLASGHPNIVPVIEAAEYDGQIAIVSEYVEGGTLLDWLEKHGMLSPSMEEALVITSGILAGLQHLHERGIIHRDLKPNNVLLQGSTPRMTDFGLARVQDSGVTRHIAGTKGYMAPEMYNGRYSEQSDIWAVGAMLYEMLSGRFPYPHRDFIEMLIAMNAAPPARIDEIADEIHQILDKAVHNDPSMRYGSAQEMRSDVEACLTLIRSGAIPGAASNVTSTTLSNAPLPPRDDATQIIEM